MFDPTLVPPSRSSADPRPLPEIIADGKSDPDGWPPFSLAFHDVEGKRYYAVQDWILGVALTDNPSNFLVKIKKRLKKAGFDLVTWCHKLPYRVSNGKTYKTDFADAETLYRITQRMDAETGLRDKILTFLAKAGVTLDDIRIDPDKVFDEVDPDTAMDAAIRAYKMQGKSEHWIAARLQGKVQREKFTSAFQRSLQTPPSSWQFGTITNTMRLGLWDRSTAKLKKEMGLKENDSLRDDLSSIALHYEMIAEEVAEQELAQKEQLTFEQARQIVYTNSQFIGQQAAETGKRLGIDVATQRRLLKEPESK